MKIINFEPHHFAYLHQSICKFLDIDPYEAKKICYSLYVGNQDTYYAMRGRRRYEPVYFGEFLNILDHAPYRPYRTVVQLYRSMETLIDSIRCCYLIEQDRTVLRRVDEMMATLEVQFLSDYGLEITSPETTYALCIPHISPGLDEPKGCLKPDANENLEIVERPEFCINIRSCLCQRSQERMKLTNYDSESETNSSPTDQECNSIEHRTTMT